MKRKQLIYIKLKTNDLKHLLLYIHYSGHFLYINHYYDVYIIMNYKY